MKRRVPRGDPISRLATGLVVFPLGAWVLAGSASAQNADSQRTTDTSSQPSDTTGQPPSAPPTETSLPEMSLTSTLSAPPPGPRFAGTSQLAGVLPVTQAALTGGEGLLRWGPVQVYPRVAYQFSYGNGLQASPGTRSSTVINQLSPGVSFRLGSHWTLDYSPTLRFYSDRNFRDTTDHAVALNGTANYEDWTFGLSQSYSASAQPLIETGAQTDQEALSTALSANYALNSKVGLQFTLGQNFRFIEQPVASESLTDSREWSTMEWVNYQYNPYVSLGLGAGFTYDDLSLGSDMTSEQFQGRLLWRPGRKLSLGVDGGLDYRQFLSSKAPALLSPTFSFSASYQVFETTSVSLAAGHSVTPSYFANEVSEGSTVTFNLQQRLLRRYFLGVSTGYSTTTFHHSSASATSANVTDYDTTSFGVNLGTGFLQRGSISVFYQASYNSSTLGLYDYTTTQVGLNLAYQF